MAKKENIAPMVLTYIGDDDPSRGDSHGFAGLGKVLAEKINSEFHYLEDKNLHEIYPGIKSTEKALKRYFRDHGQPDIILSRCYKYKAAMLGTPLLEVTRINESLSSEYGVDSGVGSELVSHHLTPEILVAAGNKIQEAYPAVSRPLIAVFAANDSNPSEFANHLIAKCTSYQEATIFLCTSRRVSSEHYANLITALEEQVKKNNLCGQVHIVGYDFVAQLSSHKAYNPYIGLLDQADHLIVYGSSQSIVSEAIATGKPPILYDSYEGSYLNLREKGLVREFNKNAAKAPLETVKTSPVNLTEIIATKLAEEFSRNAHYAEEKRQQVPLRRFSGFVKRLFKL